MKKFTVCLLTLCMLFAFAANIFAFSTGGMTSDEVGEYYSKHEPPMTGAETFYYHSISEMQKDLESKLEMFEQWNNKAWNTTVCRYADLTYYFRDHFWIPVGYNEDDILEIKIVHGGEIEVIFKDRSWMYYEYTKEIKSSEFSAHAEEIGERYGEWGDSIIYFVEPTEFILYETGIGYNGYDTVERRAVEVYDLFENGVSVARPQEGRHITETF